MESICISWPLSNCLAQGEFIKRYEFLEGVDSSK
jgi:hypothetical protein